MSQMSGPRKESEGPAPFQRLPVDFGRYRVQKLLGQGAMGAVYLADDRQLERPVALKIPRFGGERSGELLTRFYREARSAALLRQPNICPVYDVGELEGQHYISMAYIAGRPLSDLIKSPKLPSERQSLLIMRKLALAVHEAHEHGIIHRDLKPANVLIDARGEPIVMDFGLACRMEPVAAARLTHSGVIIGSPAYMSPEQVEGQPEKLTPAADQYSLGVMLYELLTGQLPFQGSITAVISQIVTKEPTPPRQLRPTVSAPVETACLRMMAKSPVDRFPSLKAVADEFALILRDSKSKESSKESTLAAASATHGPKATTSLSLADRQRQIQDWLMSGERGAARSALNAIVALTEPRQQKLVDWARQQLAQLDEDAGRWETDSPQFLELARRLVKKHDYTDAARLLEQIPAEHRSPAMDVVLEQACERRDECDLLLKDIDLAVRREQPLELPTLVKRLLQLKPGHAGMQRLAADIQRYGTEQAIRVRKGDRAYLDPAGRVWHPTLLAYLVCGLILTAFSTYMAVVTFRPRSPAGAEAAAVGRISPPQPEPIAADVGGPSWIDLLASFDTVANSSPNLTWTRDGEALLGKIGPARKNGWVAFKSNDDIAGDYDLEVDFRSVGARPVQIGLPLNETIVTFSFDEEGADLHWIDGQDASFQDPNPTFGSRSKKLEYGRLHHFTASVRHAGHNVIVETQVDGVPTGRFSGQRSRLSTHVASYPYYNRLKLSTGLYQLGADDRVEIHKAQLRRLKKPASPVVHLFNGRDLTGWTQFPPGTDTWKVVDGELKSDSQRVPSFLVSERGDYRNFVVTAIAQYETTNSGLFFRAHPVGNEFHGYEAELISQIPRGGTGNLISVGSKPPAPTQYATAPYPPPSTWFTFTIECVERRITIRIDGRTVVDYQDETRHSSEGHVVLQSYIGPIKYRSITLVELPDDAL